MSNVPADIQKTAYDLGAAIRYHIATSKTDLIHHDPVIDEMIVKALTKATPAPAQSFSLTPKQLALFEGIKEFKAAMGFAPSYEEMMDLIGAKSKSTVKGILASLEARGAIRTLPGRSRSIVIVGEPA